MNTTRPEVYATLMGVHFALLQTGYFFELQIGLTAAYPSFITVILSWLAGSVIGLRAGRGDADYSISSHIASLAAFGACVFSLRTWPYQMELAPLYATLIMISGAQAGHFFAANTKLFKSVSRLLFMENNGFIAGWIIGFFGFVMFGHRFDIIGPAMMGVVNAWLISRRSRVGIVGN